MQGFYDLSAHRIMRLAQAGRRNELLGCSSIWLCVGCGQCSARCPNELDVAGVLETLRQMARREGRVPERRQDAFAQSFLESVRANGRVFEIGFLLRYKLKTGRLFDDAELGPKLMKLGKLNLKPHECGGQAEVEAIFRRFSERGGA
jgi:heterodisulfide reductase subunit C